MKKFFCLALAGLLLCLSGCSTCKGAAQGFNQDAKSFWAGMMKADAWIKKNMW